MANSVRGILLAALLGAALLARAEEEPAVGGYKLSEFPAPGAAPVFKLLEAGEAPLRALRYRLAAGSTHQLVMTLRMSLGVEIDGRGAPVQRAPAMRMVFDCKVTEADPAGARFDFGLADPPELFETEGIPPAVLEPMKKSLASLSSRSSSLRPGRRWRSRAPPARAPSSPRCRAMAKATWRST